LRQIKFLHFADLHLDSSFASLGMGHDKASTRRNELKETFGRIINIAKEEAADLILISGDLYENGYVRKSTISYINDRFCSIPEIKIVLVPGNHDPYILNSFYRNYSWSKNVHILSEEKPCIIFEDISTCLYGIGFKSFYQEQAPLHHVKSPEGSCFNLLLAHGTVDMNIKQSGYNPMSSETLSSLGMDYIAMGHFHNRSERPEAGIYNPGSPEPLGFDEPGEHGVYLGCITLSDKGDKQLDVRFIKTSTRFYETMELDVTGCSNDEQVKSKILHAAHYKDLKAGLFSIILKGYVECSFKVSTSYIQAALEDRFFHLKIKDETIPDYNFEEIANESGLRGLFARKVFSLIAKAEDEQEKKMLMKALYYGIEALEQGRVEL